MMTAKNWAIHSILLTVLGSGIAIAPANADMLRHETHFSVTYGGLEIGKARFDFSFDGKSYALNGSGKTTGLVEWLAPSTGSVQSVGNVIENQLKPKSHSVSVVEAKKKESLSLAFANEMVVDVKFESTKKRKVRKAPKYVPVEATHLAAVLDPASTLIVPVEVENARDGNKVCNQRFPVFDGETRYDIRLRFKTVSPIETKGYSGYAYVCQMRYVPVAGHKKNHKQVGEMAANKRMEIWLAPMQGKSVFTPIKIKIGTKYGTFAAVPTYFGKAS